MSTSPPRPSTDTRTPQETPAAIASAIAQLATAPVHDFVSCISDEDNTRDRLYQRLVTRLTANEPDMWSRAKEDDVDAQLRAALGTTEAKDLFSQHVNHGTTRESVRQEAAFLLGVEVGRQVGGGATLATYSLPANETDPTPAADTAPDSTRGDHEDVSEVMIRLVSALWLAKSVADCQIGDVAKVNHYAWFALSTLLETAARDLDAAHGRYCTEHNALAAAAESGGAA